MQKLAISALLVLLFPALLAAQSRTNDIAFRRAAHLQHGINASMWFAQSSDYSKERLESYTTADDIVLMKHLGFDHVRLSIDAAPLQRWLRNPDAPNDFMTELDRVVHLMLDQKLAVIIDIHPGSDYKAQLKQGTESVERFAALWRALAGHFASSDPEMVFFEIMNEPEQEDPYRWQGIENTIAEQIREIAPQHTIIAAGAHWSGLEDLLMLKPLADPNVIYTFHDYTPMPFTHQGAGWSTRELQTLRDVPYPSSPEAIQPNMGQESTLAGQYWLAQYGLERWDAQRIDATLAFAEKWGTQYHVPLYCGEFGVYRAHSDPKMRAKWIEDMRISLEKRHIGWSMWDYQADFGVVIKKDGKTRLETGVLQALGLKTE